MSIHDSAVRDHILATASRLFLAQGYNQTGINQIIQEAGVAKASLYYHFPSKEDLCVEYLKARTQAWFDGLNHYLEDIDDPAAKLVGLFDYRAKYIQQNDFAGCSYIRIMAEVPQPDNKIHKQAVAIKESQRRYIHELVNCIPDLAEDKKASIADAAFLLFDGATVQSQVYRNTAPLTIAKNGVTNLLALADSIVF
jgi:AcrR family transcriptional regulator